jgi:hypothetical protein
LGAELLIICLGERDMILDLLQQYLVRVVLIVSAAALFWWFTFRARGAPSIVKIDHRKFESRRAALEAHEV